MLRVTFLVNDPAERQRVATELRAPSTGGDARIVSAFVDTNTVEVFLDIAESAVPREVADRFMRSLGVDEYEVTVAEALATESVGDPITKARRRFRPAAVTQVRVHPDGRTLSVQARHRPYESVERVDVEQTDNAVAITVLVGSPDHDSRDRYVSLAVAFTWVDTVLDRPVGNRQIIRDDPDRRSSRSPPSCDDRRLESSVEPSVESIRSFEADVYTDGATWAAWGPPLM